MTFDVLHMAFIAGFVSTVVGVSVHVLTKTNLESKYVTKEIFLQRFEEMVHNNATNIQKMLAQCELNRRTCFVASIREDILEIKQIQRERTWEIRKRNERDDRLWRVVLSALKVSVSEQNDLLTPADDRPDGSRTRHNDLKYNIVSSLPMCGET